MPIDLIITYCFFCQNVFVVVVCIVELGLNWKWFYLLLYAITLRTLLRSHLGMQLKFVELVPFNVSRIWLFCIFVFLCFSWKQTGYQMFSIFVLCRRFRLLDYWSVSLAEFLRSFYFFIVHNFCDKIKKNCYRFKYMYQTVSRGIASLVSCVLIFLQFQR